MKKPFVGLRLKRLREERQLTQQALANALGISLSYLNQIENNQRPITVQVLLRMNAAFGIDVQLFSGQDDGRMIGELRQVFSNPLLGETVSNSEIRRLPAICQLWGALFSSFTSRCERRLSSRRRSLCVWVIQGNRHWSPFLPCLMRKSATILCEKQSHRRTRSLCRETGWRTWHANWAI